MGRLRDLRLMGTTNGSGAATINAERSVFGRLYAVEWIDGTFENGVDATLTAQATPSGVATTLLTLTNADDDKWYFPRALVHDESGTALTGTSGGDRCLPLVAGTPRLVIADGGATKTGGCILYYYDEA